MSTADYISAAIRLALAGIMFACARTAIALIERARAMSKTHKAEPTKRADRRSKVAAQARDVKRSK